MKATLSKFGKQIIKYNLENLAWKDSYIPIEF